MTTHPFTRRRFLQATSVGGAALGTSSLLAARPLGANDRLSIGIIGAGGRGSILMEQIHGLTAEQNVEITAVCDVWHVNLDNAASRVTRWTGRHPRQFTRFGELLALKDVDAVVIATPDFGHSSIMIAALREGKDVYVEKPMSLEIDAANEALDLARSTKRVVQVGTQYRSDGAYRAAARVLATGASGHVSRISAAANFNEPRWARSYANCKKEDVDWEAYLWNRSPRPFDPKLLRRWQFYREFTNGLPGLWMSHYVDAVHLLTNATYPSSAVAHGGTYIWNDGREHSDTFHALLEYPEGFLFDWGMSLTNSADTHFAVYGKNGTLDLGTNYMTPNRLILSACGGGKGSDVAARKIVPEPATSHMGNWLECLRSRQRPTADIQYGHQHAVATIMSAAALETGRRQTYQPATRQMLAG